MGLPVGASAPVRRLRSRAGDGTGGRGARARPARRSWATAPPRPRRTGGARALGPGALVLEPPLGVEDGERDARGGGEKKGTGATLGRRVEEAGERPARKRAWRMDRGEAVLAASRPSRDSPGGRGPAPPHRGAESAWAARRRSPSRRAGTLRPGGPPDRGCRRGRRRASAPGPSPPRGRGRGARARRSRGAPASPTRRSVSTPVRERAQRARKSRLDRAEPRGHERREAGGRERCGREGKPGVPGRHAQRAAARAARPLRRPALAAAGLAALVASGLRAVEPALPPSSPFAERGRDAPRRGRRRALPRSTSPSSARSPARRRATRSGRSSSSSATTSTGGPARRRDDPARREGERRLAAQADAALGAGARVRFVPGNRDRDEMGQDGLAAVGRQQRFLERRSPGSSSRRGGCPVPFSSRPPRASGSPSSTPSGGSTTRGRGPGGRLPARRRAGGKPSRSSRAAARAGTDRPPSHHPLARGGAARRGGPATGRRTSSRCATPPPPLDPAAGARVARVGYRDAKGTGQNLPPGATGAARRSRRGAGLSPGTFPGVRARSLLQVLEAPVPGGEVGARLGLGDVPGGATVFRLPSTRFAPPGPVSCRFTSGRTERPA